MANLKRTRDDILASILDTVHRKGFNATGLSELFAVSGASSGSFYNYFRSKHELGHALIDFEWKKLQENILEPAFKEQKKPTDQVLAMLERLEAKQLAQPDCAGCLLGNLIVDLVEQDESFRTHLLTVFDEWERRIADALSKDRSQVAPEQVSEQLITLIEGIMLLGRLHRDPSRVRRGFDAARALVQPSVKAKIAV
jgi:TetR/AcrR family transcriptional regulator, transcriptional repressor for nem operon